MKQYKPLYLKYRPQKLSELAGQEVVVRTLTNAIKYNKIVHAYLFCGPRGTGKTSTARILAKSLNCESGITVEPCGKCNSCQSITNGNSLDVIEIDAASHRKVEDAEDLINRVALGTYGSRFKVYIIDEVHMLTDHAFNALLKTIEEPPANVIFILATTEEYKIIPTIISRCQKLEFKTLSQNQLETKIKNIAALEKINIDQEIINFITKQSLGCLRDAISLLDQISVLQTENEQIKTKEVFDLFGKVDKASLFELLESVLSFNEKEAIEKAENLVRSGKEITELLKNLVELLINLSKAKLSSEYREILKHELSNNLSVLDKVSVSHLLKVIEKLQDAQNKVRFALSQELQFLTEIISLIDKDFLISFTELKERIEKLETAGKSTSSRTQEPMEKIKQVEPASLPVMTCERQVMNCSSQEETWLKIVSVIESNPTKTLLTQSESHLISLSEDLIEIGIVKDMFLPRLEKDTRKKEMILKAVKMITDIEPKTIRFKVIPKSSSQQPVSGQKENFQQIPVSTQPSNNDDFSKAMVDLLGAKEI